MSCSTTKDVYDNLQTNLVSSTWGGQAGTGSAVVVGVYATTNGQNLTRKDLRAENNAHFGRWRYQGQGQEIDFRTFA